MAKQQTHLSKLGLLIWGLASLFFLYEFFLRTFVGSIAQQLLNDLHLTTTSFAMMGSAYYLAYALMQVPVGVIATKYGVRRTLMFAIFCCVLSVFCFSHSSSASGAILARILMGFGSSFAFVSMLIIATSWFPRQYFAFFVGASQFIGTLGPMLAAGPLVWLLHHAQGDWRGLLNNIGLSGFGLLLLVSWFIKDSNASNRDNLIILSRPTPTSKAIKKLFSNPQAWFIALYSACSYCPIALLAAFWGTSFLQAHGFTQANAASMISLSWVAYAVSCVLLGILSDITKRRKTLLIACVAIGAIATAILTYITHLPHAAYPILFLSIGSAAAGQSLGFATIAEHVDTHTKPTALGLNNGMITTFGVIIPPLTGYLIGLSAHDHLPHFQLSDFTIGFSIMPLMYVTAFFVALFGIKETFCKPQKEVILLQRETLEIA